MLNVVSEAASSAQQTLALVSIDPGTIVFTLINTLIIFLIFRFFLYKPVCGILDKRKEMAAAEIAEAQRAKESAEKTEQEYNELLANAKQAAESMMNDAVKKAQARETEIISEANAHAADIRAKAEEAIERDKKRAVNEIKDEITEMIVMAASKVVEKEISEKDNEEIISKFLAEVGSAE